MTRYVDLNTLEEDRRIDMIGHRVMVHNESVAFVVEKEAGKADRYIAKLKEKFPRLSVIARGDGPIPNTEYVKVARADA